MIVRSTSNTNRKTIGVFDTGIGGLLVLNAIKRKIPSADLSYIGDNLRMPYGRQPERTRIVWMKEMLDYLIEQENAVLLVAACNTLSTHLRELAPDNSYRNIPIIGMIEPTVDWIMRTQMMNVVLMGSLTTINSGAHRMHLAERGFEGTAFDCPCSELAESIEDGDLGGRRTKSIIANAVKKLPKLKQADVILACTHYPLVKELFEELFSERIGHYVVRDPANTVVDKVAGKTNEISDMQLEKKSERMIRITLTKQGTADKLGSIGAFGELLTDRDVNINEAKVFL
jgi:glutamate racemase